VRSVGLQAVAIALLSATPTDARREDRHIVILQSFDRGHMVLDRVTEDFRVDLRLLTADPVDLVQFVVNPSGFAVAPEKAVVEFVKSTLARTHKPDLVVTVGGPAAAFARKYRSELFPDVPLLFGAADQRYLDGAPLSSNETAVPVANDFTVIVDDILQLFPRTTQVFMLMGSGSSGRFWREELGHSFSRFRDRVTFTWSEDLSLPEILDRVAHLPPNTVVFHQGFPVDVSSGGYADDRMFEELRSAANAPLFASQSVYLGHGIVGGTLMPVEDLGRRTAEVAARVLSGESPGAIRLPARVPGPPVFDWRELQRWNVSESRLPPGSVVKFRGPSLWRDYRREVLLVLGGLLLQSLLIVGLLYQRRARRRAEVESRRNLALAADASRRMTMSALTGSIAHELSQPLNSILHNAQAGELLVASNRATLESLREILTDIRTADVRATDIIERHRTMLRHRQVDTKPLDLRSVVRESVALVAHDSRERHVEVDVDLPPAPVTVAGDQVLLQQVIVNLLMNAMDAMADTPAEKRRIVVRHTVTPESVDLSLRDAGTGLPVTLDGKLFEPFVTTKASGMGIGLTIARTIAEAHDGTLEARNNPDGGATVTLTLPRV
jgi:signal transduction histidine kinase